LGAKHVKKITEKVFLTNSDFNFYPDQYVFTVYCSFKGDFVANEV